MNLTEYRCHTCGRLIFYAEREEVLRSRAFCSLWCQWNATSGRQDRHQERNDQWFWLTQVGINALKVSRLYGVKPALVYKSVRSRRDEAGIT